MGSNAPGPGGRERRAGPAPTARDPPSSGPGVSAALRTPARSDGSDRATIGKACLILQPLRGGRAPPRTGRPKPTSASSTAWPRRMLGHLAGAGQQRDAGGGADDRRADDVPHRCDRQQVAVTPRWCRTAEPVRGGCGARATSSTRLRWAVRTIPSPARCSHPDGSGEGIVRQRPQRRIGDADPVDRALGVDVHPQVLQTRVPSPALEHEQREHPPEHDMGQVVAASCWAAAAGLSISAVADLEHLAQSVGGRAPRPAATTVGGRHRPSPRRRRRAGTRG